MGFPKEDLQKALDKLNKSADEAIKSNPEAAEDIKAIKEAAAKAHKTVVDKYTQS